MLSQTYVRSAADLLAIVRDGDVKDLGVLQVHRDGVTDSVGDLQYLTGSLCFRLCQIYAEGGCALMADLNEGTVV